MTEYCSKWLGCLAFIVNDLITLINYYYYYYYYHHHCINCFFIVFPFLVLTL
jgi:hypothetical protein